MESNEGLLALSPRALTLEIIRALVDHPREVRVTEEVLRDRTNLIVTVAPQDRGKVVGRSGTTIRMVRMLIARVSAAIDRRFIYIYLDGEAHDRGNRSRLHTDRERDFAPLDPTENSNA